MRVLRKQTMFGLIILALCFHIAKPTNVMANSIPILQKEELYVVFMNLPDGEATLIKTESGKNFLINTGSEKSEEELLFQLKEMEIKQIDALLLTKQTIDYCGNAERVIERYHVKKTIHAGLLSNACKSQISETNRVKWKGNSTYQLIENLELKVLEAEDNGEMSLGITYGNNSILYLSNSDSEDEEYLMQDNIKPKILKIGDYARGNSPSAALLEKIDPHISIIFNYEGDRPNDGLIERLNESWIDVYRLKQVGTTIIKMNLKDYEIIS